MKRTSWIAGALALTLLAGCGAADPDDMAYQAAGIRSDAQIATINGESIRADEYLFWLVNAVEMGGLNTSGSWDQVYGEGEDAKPLSQLAKEDALESVKLYHVVEQKAAELGVGITEEQQAELDKQMAGMAEQLGGEDQLDQWLTSRCITREGFMRINQVPYCSRNIMDKLKADGGLELTDEELDGFLEESDAYAVKHILLATRRMNEDGSGFEEFSAEERAETLNQAQELYREITSADHVEEKFDELMEEFSQDGRNPDGTLSAPEGYTFVMPGMMVEPFETASLELKVGEVSEPVQSPFGYHIILRLPVDRDQARTYCEQNNYKMVTLTEQWVEEAEVTTSKAYDELEPQVFYEKLQELLEARAAAAATPAPSAEPSAVPSEAPENGQG